MSIQTVELCGERFVILPEREFLELQRKSPTSESANAKSSGERPFRDIVPLRVGGIPASELLIQDRQ